LKGSDRRRWRERTPAMAAGITDHTWTLEELLTLKILNQYIKGILPIDAWSANSKAYGIENG
jgi:hypothetical protein